MIKQIRAKVKRLTTYNLWIFSNKSLEEIKLEHPELLESYKIFWENRMVRGGKYH
ncbi:RxLR effector protein [Phytophthora megakarya]|uniref:RxLR effector protein n=1 Tax=Phytophthora megakarya TaxID=4795 RepID=A0A225VNE0_9STRA|nr:RxLR effector protein [Phytophthora megakarya]